jgi:hypothetical protein
MSLAQYRKIIKGNWSNIPEPRNEQEDEQEEGEQEQSLPE